MTIRTAVLDDEDAVLSHIEELFEPPGAFPRGYARERGRQGFRYAISEPQADVLVAEQAGRVVGIASVYRDYLSIRDGWRCWLQDLVVTRSRRGGGTGAALLRAAVAWAHEHGCTHLELNSGIDRRDAHRFYVTQGMAQHSLSFRLHVD